MAISAKMLQYRGTYENFNPSVLLPGQLAVCLSGDPNTSSGKSVYMCFEKGTAKRILDLDDAFSDEQWQDAINNALAQAKESGEFKGEKGDTGEQGPQGKQGDTGPQGPAGSDATVTAESIKGALGYTPANQETVSKLSEEIADLKATISDDIAEIAATIGGDA